MTDSELRKIYYPIAESWKLIRQFSDATGTPVECFKLQELALEIFEKSGKTQFATEKESENVVVSATVKRKEPASGRGKGIPGFLKKWMKKI